MKRFLLFTYYGYYPRGGMSDFVDSFDEIDEAMVRAKSSYADFYDILDIETGEVTNGCCRSEK